MTAFMIPALLAASAAQVRENAVLDAFGAAGADAPARAVPLVELPPLDPDVLGRLVDRGAVREGAPGTFYRYLPATRGAARAKQQRLILLLLIALLVLGALLLGRLLRAR